MGKKDHAAIDKKMQQPAKGAPKAKAEKPKPKYSFPSKKGK